MTPSCVPSAVLLAALVLTASCSEPVRSPADDHASHTGVGGGPPVGQQSSVLPPSGTDARDRLEASPRHAEWVTVAAAGGTDSVRLWVVFPERSTVAPVVLVVHENMGLTTWVRAVADQLAADGFIAIAPDFLTGKGVPIRPDGDPEQGPAVMATNQLDTLEIRSRLDAAATWGMAHPAARPHFFGIVGFCWGGGIVFDYATHARTLSAAIVYYGSSPPVARLHNVVAPVLGLYAGNDARINMTIPPAEETMRVLGKTFEHSIFPGAGHGFLRAQDGAQGANLAATTQAWPATLAWLRRYVGS